MDDSADLREDPSTNIIERVQAPSRWTTGLVRVAAAGVVVVALAAVAAVQLSAGERLEPAGAAVAQAPTTPGDGAKVGHRGPVRTGDASPSASPLAGTGAGFTFVPVSPYRTWDTRVNGVGRIFAGEEFWFDVLTDYNGVPKIPATAVAVTFNLTVTNPTRAPGLLAAFPANVLWPGNSTINWSALGIDLANGGVSSIGYLDAPGQISIVMDGPFGTNTDFVLDITGYYE